MRTFYLGMEEELLIIKQGHEGYSYTSHLQGMKPTRLAFDPQNKDCIYCSTFGNGLWKSEDGGEKWEAIGEDIKSMKLTAVAVDPIKRVKGNSVVYAGTEPSMLYYSEDNGEHWYEFTAIHTLSSKKDWSFPPRPYTHYVRWITPSYLNENQISVSIEAGAFIRTDNYGESWIDRTDKSPIDIHTLLTHENNPGRLYAACGDGLTNEKYAYAESTDEGKNWVYMSEGAADHPYLYHMALNMDNPDDRLVSASKSASTAHNRSAHSTVYRKAGNKRWIEISEGLELEDSFVAELAADPIVPDRFYALNNYGIFILKEGTQYWEKLDFNWKEEYLNQRPSCFAVKES